MKKTLLILFVALISLTVASAQSIIFSEDFESSTSIPDGWEIYNVDGQISTLSLMKGSVDAWLIMEIVYEPDNNLAVTSSKYDNNIQADDWLITDKITLTQNNFLLWRARSSSNKPQNFEDYEVLISTTGRDIQNDFTKIYESTAGYYYEYPKIDISEYEGKDVYIAFRGVGVEGWMLFLDDISIVEQFDYDVALDHTDIPTFAEVGEIPITLKFTNWGAETINNLRINWEVVGTDEAASETLKYLNVAPFGAYNYKLKTGIKLTEAGAFQIKIWADLPNNQIDKYNANDTLTYNISVGSDDNVVKKVLVEEFTGTWCGWCPRGAAKLKELSEENPNIIPGAIHAGSATEPMLTPGGGKVDQDLVGGYPSAAIDRHKFQEKTYVRIYDDEWEASIASRLESITPVAVTVSKDYNPATRLVKVTVDAEFVSDVDGTFRYNAYIVENNVTGESNYDQANNLNTDPEYPDLYQKGNPIEGYAHQHVLRKMLGGAWGFNPESEGIPQNVNKGDKYSYTFEYTLDSGFDEAEIDLVGYLMIYDEAAERGEILNADMIKLLDGSAVSDALPTEFSIYPNPTSSLINIRIASQANIEYTLMNLLGQPILRGTSDQGSFQLNISQQPAGIYLLLIDGTVHRIIKTD